MYELYRARYRILEWRDDSVYKTEFVDTGWFGEPSTTHVRAVIKVIGDVDWNPGRAGFRRTACLWTRTARRCR